MKCPKCNEEIKDDAKFCTKCGVNIEEQKLKIAEEKEKQKKEEERRKKELDDKKRLEEIRKQEEMKREEAIKEAEKEEAIRQAKEEGIELEIIDKKPKPEEKNMEFKKPEKKEKKDKKKKVKIKKNIFQVLFNKLIFIIIVACLLIGTIYYCYTQNILPDFAQNQVEEFVQTFENVIELKNEVEENKKDVVLEENTEEEKWEIEPVIEADDIKDLNDEVSVIIKNQKQGLIDNKTGEIVLEPKYTQIFLANYYDIDKTEADKLTGIVVKDIEKFYKVDSKYQISTEVITLLAEDKGSYFYDHHDSVIYYNNANQQCTLVNADATAKGLKLCADIDIVTTEGVASKDAELPETFSIDFAKSKIGTKGYFDVSKGKLVIDCGYDEAYEFLNGYAVVKKDNLAGIIDENGKEILEIKYQETRSVHNKLAFVKKDGKWGIIVI